MRVATIAALFAVAHGTAGPVVAESNRADDGGGYGRAPSNANKDAGRDAHSYPAFGNSIYIGISQGAQYFSNIMASRGGGDGTSDGGWGGYSVGDGGWGWD